LRCGIDGFLDLLAFLKRFSLYDQTLVVMLLLAHPQGPALDGAVKLHSARTG